MRHLQKPVNQNQISTDQSETVVLQLFSTWTSKWGLFWISMQRRWTEAQHSSSLWAEKCSEKTRHRNTADISKGEDRWQKFYRWGNSWKISGQVFLQTAIIPLEINGELFHVRGVLDSASQNNLITEAAAQRLQVRRRKQTTRICGVRENEVCDIKGQVHLLIRPSDNEPISITASILQKLTNILPSRQINIDNWKTVKELQLADPRLNDPQEIDTIIGAAHYENLMIGNNKNK